MSAIRAALIGAIVLTTQGIALADTSPATATAAPSALKSIATDDSLKGFSEVGLRAADEAQLLAARTRDVDALDQMMHSAFNVNSPEGEVWPRAKVLAMWRTRQIGHDHFERSIESVVLVKDVGIVSGREIVQPSSDSVAGQRRQDGGQRVPRRFTNVWLWDQGRWWFLARHANEASKAAP